MSIAQRPATTPRRILPVIVVAQFACTSLWFAGNAVMPALQGLWHLPVSATGLVVSAVQAGFVVGTLLFAVLALSDRFRAPTVFLVCALLGALSTFCVAAVCHGLASLMAARFATGFFLAGIYPVGMKIAASWCQQGLGRWLGYLVGALVLGTAFPHLLRGFDTSLPWSVVIYSCAGASVLGGLAVYLWVPTGPYLPARSPFSIRALPQVFSKPRLRSAAFGYFGHMWELYALWAFVPLLAATYAHVHGMPHLNVSLVAFYVIGIGAVGCVAGGEAARIWGSGHVALLQLAISGLACILSPLMFQTSPAVFFTFLGVWGIAVAGDSPQFSSLVGVTAPREYVGSALTIVTCIGFAITTVSIELLGFLSQSVPIQYLFLMLVPGPVLGLFAARRLLVRETSASELAAEVLTPPGGENVPNEAGGHGA